MRFRGILTLALVSALSSCAQHDEPETDPVAAGLSKSAGISLSGWPSVGPVWSLPPGTAIDDGLTVDEAVASALWNNPDFLEALTSLDVARADLVEAGLLKNPILSLLFPVGPKQFEAAVNWSVDAVWQRPKRIASAKLNVEMVAARLVATGLRLVADVKAAYVDAVVADRVATVVSTQAATADQLAGLADSRLRLGDISELEARLSRLDATRVQASRISRNANRDRALVRLRGLLRLPADAAPLSLDVLAPLATGCGESAVSLIKAALAARPDVRAAEIGLEAAGQRAGLESAKIVALTATLDINGQGRDGFEAGPGLAVEIPLFSQNTGGRAKAAADITVAARHYQTVSASIARDVEVAFVTFQEARALQGLYGAELGTSLDREGQQLDRLHEAGEISLLGLLEARQRLNDIELARQESGLTAARARVRLEEAIGQACPVN